MRLNIGCGQFYADGWVNVDVPEAYHEGVVADTYASLLDRIPYADLSADAIYCGHVLEHIAIEDLPQALAEIRRLLKPTGELMVVGPDVDLAYEHGWDFYNAIIESIGKEGRPGYNHQWAPTGSVTAEYLREAGFSADLIDIRNVKFTWPVVSRATWQFAIEARS